MATGAQKKKIKTLSAKTADRHWLYENAVQDVGIEIEFLAQTFKRLRKRKALTLREDFCGTAAAACEWVKSDEERGAVGVDIDGPVLQWARDHNVKALESQARLRIELRQHDVMTVKTPPVDLAIAFNFSYWIFKSRGKLKRYFERVRDALVDDGIFVLDAFGGSEAFEEMQEKTRLRGFTYIWDQAKYDPVTGDYLCHIHFKFPDGTTMKQAFTYDWRLWTLPELRELLGEAGFSRVAVYWEGTDKNGEGTGEYRPVAHGEADPAWIAYIVAEK